MGINYTATLHVTPGGAPLGVALEFHLGHVRPGQELLLSGEHFPSWAAMKAFLKHNSDKLFIAGDDGVGEVGLLSFIKLVDATPAAVRETAYQRDQKSTERRQRVWLDEQGYSLVRGYFR